MTQGRIKQFCLATLLSALACSAVFADDAEKKPDAVEPTDWPATIAHLQQEVYERPGMAQIREQLAIAYNNYGVSLGNQGKWYEAAHQLQESIRVDNTNTQAKDNLSHIYLNHAFETYKQHQYRDALEAIDLALRVKPDLAEAFALKGEIEYGSQKLKEAKASWQQSLNINPDQKDIQKKLSQVTQELPVETAFEKVTQASFDVRYQEGLQQSIGFDVRDVLLEARREVGSSFAYWPKQKIVVLVYSAESFHALRQETPEWVGGQFDGKIRVPLPSRQLGPEMVRQILHHEYTHALIHDLTSGKCPTWINEGLAEYEGRKQFSGPLTLLIQASNNEKIIPWSELSENFSTALSADSIGLAYQESFSIMSFLIERYGFWRMRKILKSIDAGEEWQKIFEAEFHLKLKSLETAWQRWLPEFLKAA